LSRNKFREINVFFLMMTEDFTLEEDFIFGSANPFEEEEGET